MKKFVKVSLIAAGALCLTGIIIFLAALLLGGINAERISSKMETKEYKFEEQLSAIKIDCKFCKIHLSTSDNNVCRVVCKGIKQAPYTVKSENGTLEVMQNNNLKWYESFLLLFNPSADVTVFLPKEEYASIAVANQSGSIEADEGITAQSASLETVSGSIKSSADVKSDFACATTSGSVIVKAGVCKSIMLSSTSGRIELSGAEAQGDIHVTDTSGRISITDVTCNNLYVKITSGRTELVNTLVTDKMDIRSTSGSVTLDRCDAGDIYIENTSGRVSGTLLTGKQFIAEAKSGKVDVPQSTGDSRCEIHNVSGGIKIEVIG